MRKGEKVILAIVVTVVVVMMSWRASDLDDVKQDKGIPFYSTADQQLQKSAGVLYRELNCKNCHTLWTTRSIMQSVPAPALDGIGSLRDEKWLYDYLSSENPQSILPSRLKAEFRMPSYADLPDEDRRMLAAYLSSLKVQSWYLDETRKSEYEKLTGKEYKP